MKEYVLKNDQLELTVMELGATINSLKFKGRETVLRYDTEEEYISATTYYGAVVGRCGNRIGNAHFTLDGREYILAPNEGVNQLHGGPGAVDRRYWTVERADSDCIRMSIVMPDGDNGFPGNLKMTVTYTLENSSLRIVFEGESDEPTVFAPTVHPYFVHNGRCSMSINSDAHLEVDGALIPSGRLLPCEGRFDLSELRELDDSFDDAFVLKGEQALKYVTDDYCMEMTTDFPAVQVYSGNPGGVAIEPEEYPDAPNHANFPSIVLRPGEKFRKWATYTFC